MILSRLSNTESLPLHTVKLNLRQAAPANRSWHTPACKCMLANYSGSQSFWPSKQFLRTALIKRDHKVTARPSNRSCTSQCVRCSSTAFDRQRTAATCPICSGSTQVRCDACKGSGRLTKSGYHARNPVNAAKIVGTVLDAFHTPLLLLRTMF